jgi:hypothetical protein
VASAAPPGLPPAPAEGDGQPAAAASRGARAETGAEGNGQPNVAVSPVARADARAALAEGNRLFKGGDLAGALIAYRRAQAIYPAAAGKVDFNIGKVEEALRHEDAAAEAFERFLAQSPASTSPEFREEASAALARLSPALGRVNLLAAPEGLSIMVDGEARGRTPLAAPLWLRAGRHALSLQDGERVTFKDEIEVRAGDTAQVALAAAPPPIVIDTTAAAAPVITTADRVAPGSMVGLDLRPVAPADAAPSRPVWKRWWFWSGVGAAVAAGVVTSVLLSGRWTGDPCPPNVSCNVASVGPKQ